MCKSQNLKSLIKTFSSLWQVRVFKSCRKTMKYGFQGISGCVMKSVSVSEEKQTKFYQLFSLTRKYKI